METKDSVGNFLNGGDTIVLTKTLNIKGMCLIYRLTQTSDKI